MSSEYAAAQIVIEVAADLAGRGWVPATSGNFSHRIDAERIAITVSGTDKGRLTHDDMMIVDLAGRPVGSEKRPSAETLLHTELYERFDQVACVLHTHSPLQTVASRLFADAGRITFDGYELAKALQGVTTHETSIALPVFPNTQHIPDLAAQVTEWLDRAEPNAGHGYLIASHGLYAWGEDADTARRHLEAFEFLLACELELLRLGQR